MKFFTNMFEMRFKSKFDSKCKSYLKLTLTRIEMIRKRRKAMQKYLRSDIAELLRVGLNSNAYGRVGRLYLDQKRTLCYDFIEQFCTHISNHVTTMKEQSECPEECREAVPSLMYAAARFADLPELRELRSLFSERYENSLESFVNKEFVDLLKPERPTKDMKIQLMQDIALEYGVEWDSESLEQTLYKLPSSDKDRSQNGNESHTTRHENGLMINIQETGNEDVNNGTRVEKNDESKGELEKQTENVLKRISDHWSSTTSLLSTSWETTTSSEGSSSSDLSTKRRPFFPFRFMPPPYVKKETSSEASPNSARTKQTHDHKKDEEVLSTPNIENGDDGEAAAPRVKNSRRRKGGAPPRKKSHSTECLPNPVETEPQRAHARCASYQPDSSVSQPRHVHPKLPDYDDIIARFAALRAKS